MAAQGHFETVPEFAVFADTGWEPRAVYQHLDWLTAELAGRITVQRVAGGNLREDALDVASASKGRFASMPLHVLKRSGEKGQLRRQCTKEYKLAPIRRHLRAQGLTAVEMWIGISLDEVERARPSGLQWVENAWPLLDVAMTRAQCAAWLEERGYPEPPKSACIGCPYTDNRRWLDLRENRPDEWADAVAVDSALRHMPGIDGQTFLHPQLVPLAEAVLDPADAGQLSFAAECAGMCGV
jgi:hypothetical protein